MNKPKSIQVIPSDPKLDEQVNELARQLRTSRSGLAGLALDFFVPRLAKGEVTIEIQNGKPVFKTQAANVPAKAA